MSVSFKEIDHGWDKIKKELKLIDNSHVNVGVLSDVGGYPEGNVSLADVATFNEYGTSDIPPRPFMRQSFDTNRDEIKTFTDKEVDAIYSGKQNVKGALEKIGVYFVGKVKETFSKGEFVENAPSTIAKKGSSKPLIDTGRLRNSIDHKVELK